VPQGKGTVSGMVYGIFRKFGSIDLNGNMVLIMVLINDRLVCEKLTVFPYRYAECIVEFCEGLAFL